MRIAHLTRSTSRLNGGIYFAQVGLLNAISLRDPSLFEICVFGGRDAQTEADHESWGKVRLEIYSNWPLTTFGYSPALLAKLRRFDPQVVHVHGLWSYGGLAALLLNRERGTPIVISPHGMLDPWALALSRRKKAAVTSLYQRSLFTRASVALGLNPAEGRAIRSYHPKVSICVVPNGTDLPEMSPRAASIGSPNRVRKILYLGRIHPKKGLTELVEAWVRFIGGQTDKSWHLTIAGWDELGLEKILRDLVTGTSAGNSVTFAGPQWGLDKERLLRETDALILPSHSEGLPMAILEAWSYAKPTLQTPACNLPAGPAAGAAIEIEPKAPDILRGLTLFASLSEERVDAMGAAARKLVETEYSWTSAAEKISRLYQAVGHRQPPPPDLRFSA